MRIALDTNFLAYAEGLDGSARRDRAWEILERLSDLELAIPVQVLGELYNVLSRKARLDPDDARAHLMVWRDSAALIDTTAETALSAMELAARHKLQFWDSIIIAASSHAGCRLLLSEDMQNGFTWSGLTVVNPFLPEPHALLADLLR